MLKRSILPIVLLCSSLVQAAADVVVVDFSQLIQKSTELVSLQEGIEAELKKMVKVVEELDAKIKANMDKLQSAGKDMSDSAKSKIEKELAEQQGKRQIEAQHMQMTAQKKMQELEQKFGQKVKDQVSVLAQKNGWKVVLPGGAIYVDPSCDKTDDVVKALNAQFKGSPTKKS